MNKVNISDDILNDTIHKIIFDIINDESFNVVINKQINEFIINAEFYDNSIDGSCIKNNSINEQHICNYSITEQKLSNDSVSINKIQDGSISNKKIMNNSIHSHHIMNYSITNDKLSISSVSTSNIEDNSITTNKICDGSITLQKLSKNVFSNIIIPNNYITNAKLANHTITASKIAFDTITAEHLEKDIFSHITIYDNSISGNKIKSNTINFDKFSPNVMETLKNIINGIISTFNFNKIIGNNIENETITSSNLVPHTILLSNLNDEILQLLYNPIISNKSITGNEIALNTITIDNLNPNIFTNLYQTIPSRTISGSQIAFQTITIDNLDSEIFHNFYNNIPSGSISGSQIALNTITIDNLNTDVFKNIHQNIPFGSITGSQIALNTITINNLNTDVFKNIHQNIPSGSITGSQIASKTITYDNLHSDVFSNISLIQIPNSTITISQLSPELQNIINNSTIKDNSITANMFSSNLIIPVNSSSKFTFVGTDSQQILANKIFNDNSVFFQNNLDTSKKFRFDMSNISTNTTCIIAIPDISTTLVGTNTIQTITNKIINSDTNDISCNKFRLDSIKNINVVNATCEIGQTFVSINPTTMTLQYLSHLHLLDAGIFTHSQIDSHIQSSTSVHGVSSSLVGISDVQLLSNKTLIDSLFVNSSNLSKKMSFNILNSNQSNIILTVPSNSTTIVGNDSIQTLTNKTLDHNSNVITADNLHSTTTTININNSIAPSTNQVLMANSSTSASWKNIDHINIQNTGNYTHMQIDDHINSSFNIHGLTSNIVGTDDIQLLKNKKMDSQTIIFTESSDNTKNMHFILSNLDTSTNISLTVPSISTTLVGNDNIQIITNKTLDSPTNIITCDNLRSRTNTVNINSSAPPTVNQSLVATSPSIATWQTINHSNLTNIGINTHIQIDNHLSANSNIHGIIGNIVGTSDMQTLTNKTLNSTTNIITCDNLRSSTGIINIYSSSAPSLNQSLIATSSTSASWQTINHSNLSNIGTNTHVQIDTHLAAISNVHGISGNFVGTTDIQTLTNKTLVSSNVFADSTDNTKKMNFVLTSLTTSTTVALMIPSLSTTLVGTDSIQTLTNKTLNSTTNIITCDNLRSVTGIININTATAPTVNQVLTATSGTIANWQTINHTNLSNIGTNTHAQIDTHLSAIFGVHGISGNFVGTTDIQTLTNKTFISTNTFADSTDNTKKMNFVLSSLVTGTNILLTIPTSSTTLVGIDSNQILTNKTLNSTTNIITCDNLRSSNGIININTAMAPTVNQVLTATSGTTANWQTINHTNLSNIGTNTHTQIDTHLAASYNVHGITGNVVGTTDIQTLTNKTIDTTNNINLVNYSICLATTITNTSTSYVTMSGMTITPVAGTYLVNFNASFSQSNAGTTCNWGICNTATLQPITNVSLSITSATASTPSIMVLNYIVTADGINPVQILYKTSAGTITITNRFLSLVAI